MSDEAVTAPPAAPYRQVGDLLFLSGQVGVDNNWVPVNSSFRAEAEQVFRNLQNLLEDASASLDDVAFVRTYLADLNDFEEFNRVWSQFFPDAPPARVTIQAGLHPPFRIEAEVVAHLRART